MKTLLLLVVIIFGSSFKVACAEEISDQLFEVVKVTDESNIKIIEYKNIKYLVSIGEAQFRPNDAHSISSSLRVSKIRAEESLVKFIYGSKTSINETLVNTFTDGNNIIDNFISEIKEKLSGDVPPYIDIGNWNDGNNLCFSAIALALKSN